MTSPSSSIPSITARAITIRFPGPTAFAVESCACKPFSTIVVPDITGCAMEVSKPTGVETRKVTIGSSVMSSTKSNEMSLVFQSVI
jgi:hypothetical protein